MYAVDWLYGGMQCFFHESCFSKNVCKALFTFFLRAIIIFLYFSSITFHITSLLFRYRFLFYIESIQIVPSYINLQSWPLLKFRKYRILLILRDLLMRLLMKVCFFLYYMFIYIFSFRSSCWLKPCKTQCWYI